jgi:DNA-binding NarL/FixJ family response regulator
MGRIIVADHEPLFREGIRAVLAHLHTRLECALEYEETDTLDGVMEAVDGDDDVRAVILDSSLLHQDGTAAILTLRARLPEAALVIFAPSIDPETARLCMTCGAAGYLVRTSRRDEIFAALQTILRGGNAAPDTPRPLPGERSVTQTGFAMPRDVRAPLLLSFRQMAVLNLVNDGKPNKQIAWELSISETTVKAHMTAILRKLGVNSRAQAIVLLQRQHARATGPRTIYPVRQPAAQATG